LPERAEPSEIYQLPGKLPLENRRVFTWLAAAEKKSVYPHHPQARERRKVHRGVHCPHMIIFGLSQVN
jgi:hypothetical protein